MGYLPNGHAIDLRLSWAILNSSARCFFDASFFWLASSSSKGGSPWFFLCVSLTFFQLAISSCVQARVIQVRRVTYRDMTVTNEAVGHMSTNSIFQNCTVPSPSLCTAIGLDDYHNLKTIWEKVFNTSFPLVFCLCSYLLPVHGSLARAGKVKSATPKVDKQEKKKAPKGRAKKRILYNRRCVCSASVGYDDDGLTLFFNKFRECHNTTWWKEKNVSLTPTYEFF